MQPNANRVRPPSWLLERYKGAYYVYSKNSGSISASATTGIITVPFNDEGAVFAIGCTATLGTLGTSNATAALGYRDVFTLDFQRQNNKVLVTERTIATSLFGLYDGFLYLAKPWHIKRGETIVSNITNLFSTTAVTVYQTYHFISMQGGEVQA